MKLKSLIILGILFCCTFSFANSYFPLQKDSINRGHSTKKKDGFLIEYLDANLRVTKNTKASFYRYVYYEKGYAFYVGAPLKKKEKLLIEGNQPCKDSAVIMNGIYKVYNKRGVLLYEEKYMNGAINFIKVYSKNGKLVYLVDYNNRYNGMHASAYFEEYNNDGSLIFKGYKYYCFERKKIIQEKK